MTLHSLYNKFALFSLMIALTSSATAAEDLAQRVDLLEAKAAHLSSKDNSFRSLVSQGIENLDRKKSGYVDGLQLIEVQKLNRKAAAEIVADSESLRIEAVQLLQAARNTLGFHSVQQGETAALGDRVFAIIQLTRCVEFETELVSQNQYVPEALSLALSVAEGCKRVLSVIRNEPIPPVTQKQKKK